MPTEGCHGAFKASVVAMASTKAWSRPCHQVFKAGVLAMAFPKPGAGDLAIESSKLELCLSPGQCA